MTTQISTHYDIVTRLPAATEVIFYQATWEEYEALLKQVGEASGLRLSFNDGTLKVMTLSPEHEKYVRFIESLITALRLRLRLNIVSFGSATMRQRKKQKGNEPDACFYVQSAALIGHRLDLDFTVDPPPDIVVEIDLHHDSRHNYPIYAALGVAEIWRYDGQTLTIAQLAQNNYVNVETSPALPMLTSQLLTEYLTRLQQEGELAALLAFDEWLQTTEEGKRRI